MSSATQTSNLTETPVAGIWDIDPSHTTVEFIGRHLVFTKVRGRFTDVAGHVTISEDPTASSVEVTLNSASVNTGHDDRDGHLKSADFFDVENHPVITFKSTKVEWNGSEGTVTGDLTVKVSPGPSRSTPSSAESSLTRGAAPAPCSRQRAK